MSAFPAVIAGVLLAGGLAACSAQSTSTPPSGPVTSATSASVVSSPSSAQAGVIPWVNRPARQDNGAMPGAAPGTTTGTVTGSGDGFDTECGLGVSEFGVPADVPVSPAPSPLTATITAPSAARAGMTLSYQITLSNPTGKPFALSPCPSYAEYLGGVGGGNVTQYFYLNCAAALSIPANGSVTFQMELAVPASMQPMAGAKLDWQIQGGTGPAQASVLHVVG
jgi:hypothetical protein